MKEAEEDWIPETCALQFSQHQASGVDGFRDCSRDRFALIRHQEL